MKFLLPVGGVVDHRFGIITTPAHGGIVDGIKAGMVWAADNEAFTVGFKPERFFPWLERMKPYRDTCLFITVPDVVGDAVATLARWDKWVHRFTSWPLAFVAQNGQESLPMPASFDALFIGGSTEWKESGAAIECIKRGQKRGTHIHIGRVNWGRRYRMFRVLEGSEHFTCDGTRTRFAGVDKSLSAWGAYQAQPPLLRL